MKMDNFKFPSLEDFLTEATADSKLKANTESPSTAIGNKAMRGSYDFAEAVEMARKGWPEGLEKLAAVRELVAMPQGVASLVPVPCISEEGDEVLIDRYLDGESDCWVSFPMAATPQRGRIVSVWVHVSGGGRLSADVFASRGAAALALIDALENAGFRAEVTITAKSQTEERQFNFRAVVKRAEDTLDLDRMSFCLMSAAVQRRLLFRLRERSAAPTHWVKSRMGYSHNLSADEIPEGVIYFPIPDRGLTVAEAAEQCAQKLNAYLATA